MFPSWKALLLVATLPNLITIVLYKWVPESPSWLLCKGKTEEAEDILTFMAKVNRRDPAVCGPTGFNTRNKTECCFVLG